jgi:hypothetical protein
MVTPHNLLNVPADDTKLWRYQDIPRYIDLLLRRQLFFSRADRFEDPQEGRYPRGQRTENADKELKRSFVTINSWHSNKDENYAMWKIYGRGTYGLAIQTNLARLKKAFEKTGKEIIMAAVQYYDNEQSHEQITHELAPFLHKRNIYSYENEMRCCYIINGNEQDFNWQEQDKYDGVFIDVDLDELIECIYVSPYSPQWIRDIIAGINQQFNIKGDIVHSTVFDVDEY